MRAEEPALTEDRPSKHQHPKLADGPNANQGDRQDKAHGECADGGLTFAEVLDILGITDGEYTSVCHQPVGGVFTSAVTRSDHACHEVGTLPQRSCQWFGVNPTTGPERRRGGRGKERDVSRWAAVYLDLDVKPGAFENIEAAYRFIAVVSGLIGTRPSVIIHSGHGLQVRSRAAGAVGDRGRRAR